MIRPKHWIVAVASGVFLGGGLLLWAEEPRANDDSERKVQENEVPAAALAALKKLAGGAPITEFEEEIEDGRKSYEASWKGPDGGMEAEVTEAGDVLEVEVSIAADKVPVAVRAAVEKEAGKDATVTYEKVTLVVYEAHFKKGDKGHEMVVTADGRGHREEGEKKGDDDDDEKDDD